MADHGDEIADTASTTSSSCEDNRIKVVCRVRPPVSRETHGAKTLSVANRCVVVADDKCTVTLNSKPQEKNFTFDYAAGEDSTQEELFAEVCVWRMQSTTEVLDYKTSLHREQERQRDGPDAGGWRQTPVLLAADLCSCAVRGGAEVVWCRGAAVLQPGC